MRAAFRLSWWPKWWLMFIARYAKRFWKVRDQQKMNKVGLNMHDQHCHLEKDSVYCDYCANFVCVCDTIDDSGVSTQRHDDEDKCAK